MLSKVKCVTFSGLQVIEVDVEVSVTRGIPSFEIVGLPNKSIQESKFRIKSAFINSGFDFADSRITVNLAPADILKVGTFYDLAIAVGIYCAKNKISTDSSQFFFGELSLDGVIRATRGAYLALDYISNHLKPIFISNDIQSYFLDFKDAEIYPCASLRQVFEHISDFRKIHVYSYDQKLKAENGNRIQKIFDPLITDIVGQNLAKRALEIAAAGGHNLMLVGSPGTGKSMLAKSILSILPDMTFSEIAEIKRIKSYSGIDLETEISRPFRAPHHTISYAGMIGGSVEPLPGEITLAHKGVLFMDEFCEFSRNVLESLRQPMQDGYIRLTRNNVSYTFPSEFSVIAASNPCPCGYLGHIKKSCTCSEQKIANYTKKLSGPLSDRFDLFVTVFPETEFISEMDNSTRKTDINENLAFLEIKKRVNHAKQLQVKRLQKFGKTANACMTNREIFADIPLSAEIKQVLAQAYEKLILSPRAYFKVVKVARTIADLENSSEILISHILEALQFRHN